MSGDRINKLYSPELLTVVLVAAIGTMKTFACAVTTLFINASASIAGS